MKQAAQLKAPVIPKPQLMYGETVHWLTVVSCLISLIAPVVALVRVDRNVLNPHFLFAALWDGKGPNQIWQEVGTGFPGGHFYLRNMSAGDGFALFGIALGCSAALWALLPAVAQYAKEREYFYAGVCLFTAVLIALSMIGLTAFGD